MIKQACILTGGSGSRLQPFTSIASKQLFPIGDKFVIDFPLQTLKQLGVKDLVVILGGPHFQQVVQYIKDGSALGFDNVQYIYQSAPEGISHAIFKCEKAITEDNFAVLLGDNYFENEIKLNNIEQYGAQIVLCKHNELDRFGVASINKNSKIEKIEEKPKVIDTSFDNFAISGLYIFDREFFNIFKRTKKSARNEYEIVDIIKAYQENNSLGYTIMDGKWGDLGTFNSIKEISNYIENKK